MENSELVECFQRVGIAMSEAAKSMVAMFEPLLQNKLLMRGIRHYLFSTKSKRVKRSLSPLQVRNAIKHLPNTLKILQ